MSQTRSVPFDFTTSANVMTPSSEATVAPISATADIGSGARTMPAIVATKMASIRHARGSTPSGAGTNQMMTPTTTGRTNRPVVDSFRGADPRARRSAA